MLRSSSVKEDGPKLMLGGNMSVILNSSIPSSILKKKHHAIAYHRIREAMVAMFTLIKTFYININYVKDIKFVNWEPIN
jgi:hypothetical protein